MSHRNETPTTIYRGWIEPDAFGPQAARIVGGKPSRLDPRFDLDNHSPDGFAWGYAGSGPAQLALAILADALGDDERALRLHQRFKFRVLCRLPQNEGWAMTAADVLRCVEAIEAEEASR